MNTEQILKQVLAELEVRKTLSKQDTPFGHIRPSERPEWIIKYIYIICRTCHSREKILSPVDIVKYVEVCKQCSGDGVSKIRKR